MSPAKYPELIKDLEPFHYREQLNIVQKFPMEVQLRDMAEVGIDCAVLSGNPRLHSVEDCRLFNDEIARWVEAHPDKFIGFAHAPPIGEDGLAELERAVKDLGFKAYQGHISNVDFQMMDSEELYPLYKKAEQLDIPIFVHPSSHPLYPSAFPEPIQKRVRPYSSGVNREFDLIIAIICLVQSDVLEKFPTLKFVFSHLGGGISAMMGRIWSTEGLDDERRKPRERAWENFKKIYVDTAGFRADIDTLKFALTKISPTKIVFGTDCPPGSPKEITHFVKDIKNLEISEKDKDLILGGNAATLLKL